jgi:hypothetical protein
MSLQDVVKDLRSYEQPEQSGQEPIIYAAEPWVPTTMATVGWGLPKGGLPSNGAPLLLRLCEVRMALTLLGDVYDRLCVEHRYADLTELLVSRVLACNSSGKPYIFNP